MTLREKIARALVSFGTKHLGFEVGGQEPTPSDEVDLWADRILALLAESGWRHVPEGSVVVPNEADEEMVSAGIEADTHCTVDTPVEDCYRRIYRAMLAAAPK